MAKICIFDATKGPRIQERAATDLPAVLEIEGMEYGRFDFERDHEGVVELTPLYSTHLPTRPEVEIIYSAIHGDKPGSRAVR
jgi:hypothetical protein